MGAKTDVTNHVVGTGESRATVRWARVAGLTPAERRVAQGLDRGLTNPAIARSIGRALDTVKGHVKRIRRKAAADSAVYDVIGDALRRLPRQKRRVAELVAKGLSDEEIAEALKVRPGTVSRYLSSICRELGVRGRRELIACVLASGLGLVGALFAPPVPASSRRRPQVRQLASPGQSRNGAKSQDSVEW